MTLGQATEMPKLSATDLAFQKPVGPTTEMLRLYIETADLQGKCSKRKAKVGGQ